MSLLDTKRIYKPFKYPWAYDAWLQQQRIHWIPEEVPLADDVSDWNRKLTKPERNLLSQIFRFFTQSDIEVNNCYMSHYSRVFKPTEVCMMLAAFSNMETIHIAAYSHLLDTIGMPEVEYSAFLEIKEMRDKYDYMQKFNTKTKINIAKTLAIFGGFTEGLQLFATFAILLNFPRFNKMKGMGQIVTWSARDESLHTESIIKLYNTFVSENPELLEGQVHGGIVQGIGQALFEETIYDNDTGQLVTGSFMDYALPRASDIPFIKFSYNEILCDTNPLGVKGAGEAGAIGSPPAVINAICNALDIDHIDMPAKPQKIWNILFKKGLSINQKTKTN